jgi:hypothetical protein
MCRCLEAAAELSGKRFPWIDGYGSVYLQVRLLNAAELVQLVQISGLPRLQFANELRALRALPVAAIMPTQSNALVPCSDTYLDREKFWQLV